MLNGNPAGGGGGAQPVVSIAADPTSVAEGSAVEFTLTASPEPAAELTVNLSWSQVGSFYTGTPPATATIPTSGTVTVSWTTDDDSTDEPDGSVTLTVTGGNGYTVGSPGSATVAVTGDDTTSPPVPPVSPQAPPVTVSPDVTSVVEGAAVEFTLTASPAPAAELTVNLSWSQVGSFYTGTPPATATIPTSGTVTVSWTTDDDSTDETDGSVTLTVTGGNGYTVGAPGSATVAVADDDTSIPRGPRVTLERDSGTTNAEEPEGETLRFNLIADPRPAANLTVNLSWSQVGSFYTVTPPATATINANQRQATVALTTDDDSTDEPDGWVILAIADGADYERGSPRNASVKMLDDD